MGEGYACDYNEEVSITSNDFNTTAISSVGLAYTFLIDVLPTCCISIIFSPYFKNINSPYPNLIYKFDISFSMKSFEAYNALILFFKRECCDVPSSNFNFIFSHLLIVEDMSFNAPSSSFCE